MFRLPKNIAFSDHKHVLPFYSHTKNGLCLTPEGQKYWLEERKVNTCIFSNLWECNIKIDSDIWASTEHYFQIYKYGEGDKNFMLRLSSNEVASFGQVPAQAIVFKTMKEKQKLNKI